MGDKNMNATEINKLKKLAIFESILNGENTVSILTKKLEMGHKKIEDICESLQRLNLIYRKCETEVSNGRPPLKYFPVDSHFCVYIEESNELFSAIFIDRTGKAVKRIDKRKNPVVETQLILSRFIRDINEYDQGRGLCKVIFIDCYDETASILPSEFQRVKCELLIAESLKTNTELSLFVFDNLCILNHCGKLSILNKSAVIIKDTLPIENLYTFTSPYYHELFDALAKITTQKMKEMIL